MADEAQTNAGASGSKSMIGKIRAKLGVPKAQFDALVVAGMPTRNLAGAIRWLERSGINPDGSDRNEFSTVVAIAKALGVNARTFREYTSETGWEPPYKLDETIAWLKENRPSSSVLQKFGFEPPDLRASTSKNKLYDIKAERAQFEFDRERDLYILVDDAERFYARSCGYANAIISELPNRIDTNLPENVHDNIRQIVRLVVTDTVREALTAVQELIEGDRDDTRDLDDDDE